MQNANIPAIFDCWNVKYYFQKSELAFQVFYFKVILLNTMTEYKENNVNIFKRKNTFISNVQIIRSK